MIAILAENHLAYRGKLKDMCEYLGISNCSKNKQYKNWLRKITYTILLMAILGH